MFLRATCPVSFEKRCPVLGGAREPSPPHRIAQHAVADRGCPFLAPEPHSGYGQRGSAMVLDYPKAFLQLTNVRNRVSILVHLQSEPFRFPMGMVLDYPKLSLQ
jgi:hypothetical protein